MAFCSRKKDNTSLTIQEVARRIGVSTATVSRVMNNVDHPVKPETRRKVLEAIRELNYSTNLYAKGLSGRPNAIGLSLGFSLRDDQGCVFTMAGVIDGINEIAREQGYHVFLDVAEDESHRLPDSGPLLAGVPLAGVLVLAPHNENPLIDELLERKIPFVIIGSRAFSQCNFVEADNYNAGRKAVEHLAGLGRRRIACLGGPSDFAPALDMSLGFRSKLNELGLEQRVGWFDRDNWTVENGRRMASRMLQLAEPPDAIFAGNDFLALGAMQAARELGVRVPDDLAIVGYDDYIVSELTRPPLTTFRHPDREMAIRATRWLLEEIIPGNTAPGLHQELVMPELVVRQSCGACLNKQSSESPHTGKKKNGQGSDRPPNGTSVPVSQ